MSSKNLTLFLSGCILNFCFLISCSSTSTHTGSVGGVPKNEDIIVEQTVPVSSPSQNQSSVPPTNPGVPPETQNPVRTASVWIEGIGNDAFLALGFLQESEKHIKIESVNGIGFGCWIAMSWASENRGSYAEWQAFKWDSWDVLGSNILNRMIGKSTPEALRARLENRMPLKNKDKFKIPEGCPFVYKEGTSHANEFQATLDLPVHEELWIQMRNSFYFPMADTELDERQSGLSRVAVKPEEFIKFTPVTVKPEEHLWLILSTEAVRKELRRVPQPELQRGIINGVRYVKKVIAPGEYGSMLDVKDFKKRRPMLLKGRKEGKAFFDNPAVSNFIGFGSVL